MVLASIHNGVSISANGQNVTLTIDASVPTTVGGGIFFDGGTGNSALIGPARDATWDITGSGAGDLGGPGFVQFSGVTNLQGAADNRDTFHMTATGSIAGLIDGGSGDFGSLIIDSNTPGTSSVYRLRPAFRNHQPPRPHHRL